MGLAAWAAVLAWRGAEGVPGGQADVLIAFGVNGALHLLWSPLFFKWKRPDWALIEVVFLWVSVAVMMVGLWRYSSLAGWLILPYLLWVSFASAINLAVTRLNGPFGTAASA